MPVSSFALMICGVIGAAALTIAVAFALAESLSAPAAGAATLVLLVAALLLRRLLR